jgi:hypothetical protein
MGGCERFEGICGRPNIQVYVIQGHSYATPQTRAMEQVRKPGRPMVRCERSECTCESPNGQMRTIRSRTRKTPQARAMAQPRQPGRPTARCERSEGTCGSPGCHVRTLRARTRRTPQARASEPVRKPGQPMVRRERSDGTCESPSCQMRTIRSRERPRRHAQVSRCDHLFLRAWTPDLDGTCFAHDARHDEPTLASIDGLAGHACPAHARLRLEVGAEGWREARLARAEPAAVVARRERVARWWTFKMLAGMLRQPWTQPWRLRLSPAGTLPRAVRAGPAFCRVVVQPRAVSRRMMAVRATSALSPSVPAAAPVE